MQIVAVVSVVVLVEHKYKATEKFRAHGPTRPKGQ